ncbi:MAG: phosphatidate cytidylyltransferase [Kiritimatiellia bacterium]
MKNRIIYGVGVGAAAILAIFFLPLWAAFVAMMGLSAVLMAEFYALFKAADPPFPIFDRYGIGCGLAWLTVVFFDALPGWPTPACADLANWERFVIFMTIAVVMIRQFPQKRNTQPIMTIAGTLFGVFYAAYLLTFMMRLAIGFDPAASLGQPLGPAGRFLILFLLVTVKISDSGALFVGCRYGKNKLFSRISPNKTWEGLYGGIVAGMVGGVAIFACMGEPNGVWWDRYFGTVHLTVWEILGLGILLTIFGAVGDMVESLIKRAVDVKDSGRVIPGMGGLLDVFDSILYTAPILYFYVKAFAN